MMSNHVEHDPVGTQVTSDSVSFEWRTERFEEIGFSKGEAMVLAASKQISYTGGKDKNSKKIEWETPLDWKKVKSALDGGCSPEMALEIFT